MRLRETTKKRREPDLTGLINIVFLILIFFIVAGTLRPFSARDIELTKVSNDVVDAVAPGKLVAFQDGTLRYATQTLTVPELGKMISGDPSMEPDEGFTVVADERLNAQLLLEISRQLKSAGLKNVSIMTERSRK